MSKQLPASSLGAPNLQRRMSAEPRWVAPSFVTAIRGRVGDQVYKTYGRKIVVTRVPSFEGYVPTREQRACRDRLREATAFAQRVYADPAAKAFYASAAAKLGRQPFRLAISDYLSPAAAARKRLQAARRLLAKDVSDASARGGVACGVSATAAARCRLVIAAGVNKVPRMRTGTKVTRKKKARLRPGKRAGVHGAKAAPGNPFAGVEHLFGSVSLPRDPRPCREVLRARYLADHNT